MFLLTAAQRCPMEIEIRAMVELALARSGYSHKEAAIDIGKDESQFSRELGSGLLRLRDFFRLRPEFWNELLPLLAAKYGMQVTSEDAAVRAMSDMADLMGRLARQLGPARQQFDASRSLNRKVSAL